jgi:hypothetical protein
MTGSAEPQGPLDATSPADSQGAPDAGGPGDARSSSEAGRGRMPQPARMAGIAWGIVLVLVGLWFFADQTLGIDLPGIPWGDLWPLVIIAFGVWIIVRAMGFRRR